MSLVAEHCGHVWPMHAVMLEVLVDGLHAHCPHALGNQIAHRIIHHRRNNRGPHPEAIRQVRSHVELAAAHVNLALSRLAKRDDSRIEPMNQCTQREKIQLAILANIQSMTHRTHSPDFRTSFSKV